ncbi:SDR family oxidoreductase [Duganella violaceipulchra]|uniref:NAD(P)-dependent dehydrogenase (Short-subunit alcohol dehydrogenase family) n=1 Tax=Duganella violaceipulchra TaxID=2849652 RepID=A0AA41H8T0_9BURK|nr:SDR family oxidoreductase [Duganella violaceicalia]MBV6324187.1 SDR family oxidoreductase [Duganella violaceicalia]MCP2011880.1 NAD(P)-dependent dehydrogenase (short-subunit alcohol dehydrogenase family) [Duganella violaceicalia]
MNKQGAGPERVFITGASSGLGAALAAEYAAQGATLGLLARRSAMLDQLIATLPNPERHRAYAVDVRDHAAIAAAAQAFMAHAGGIDVVIANAGISVGTLTEFAEDIPVFEAVIATNVVATAATFAPFIPAMKAQRTPARLVGIGSVAGIRGLPGAEAYSASKAAVISYCESLRLEMKPYGIRVVTLCPGYIDTPMTQVNPYPMPFLMAPATFAAKAARTIAAGNSYKVIPWQMGVVAKLLRMLPNPLYDLAFAKAPHKPRKAAP